MGERRCIAEEAFEVLAEISQHANRKLRDVATALVEQAHPSPDIRGAK
jgi:AmiR/NasT family two-component response regulator